MFLCALFRRTRSSTCLNGLHFTDCKVFVSHYDRPEFDL